MVKHTILLIQFTQNKSTRQYQDYNSVANAMDGICGFFEQKLRQMNPNVTNITYDINDLYQYIDSLGDLGALTLDPRIQAYVPHNKEWIKQRVFKHLKKMAQINNNTGNTGNTRRGGSAMQM